MWIQKLDRFTEGDWTLAGEGHLTGKGKRLGFLVTNAWLDL